MTIREMRAALGITQSEFAARYNIPFRTVQNWEADVRHPPEYITELLEERVRADLVNRKTATLPQYNPQKHDLPGRSGFPSAMAWLKAVRRCLGVDIVFALDNALMCQGYYDRRGDGFPVWVYGDDEATQFNDVVILGNQISSFCVRERNGLLYTNFNRTLSDALANESILDLKGITKAVNRYYFRHGGSFDGIVVPPEYQERFESLAKKAVLG